MLEKGHEDVKLSREELDKIIAWIDLSVPFCGDYAEAHDWSPGEVEKYERYLTKRHKLAGEERESIARWLAQGYESGE